MSDKPLPTYMFHAKKGKRVFDMSKEDPEQLEKDGWKDTPAGMNLEKKEPEGDTGPVALSEQGEEYLAQFVQDPESLNKDELVSLGNEFELGLKKAWKEQTLINKIQDYLNDNG